jgi:hypothetical protein
MSTEPAKGDACASNGARSGSRERIRPALVSRRSERLNESAVTIPADAASAADLVESLPSNDTDVTHRRVSMTVVVK